MGPDNVSYLLLRSNWLKHLRMWWLFRDISTVGVHFLLPLGVFIIRRNELLLFRQLSKPLLLFSKRTGCVTLMYFHVFLSLEVVPVFLAPLVVSGKFFSSALLCYCLPCLGSSSQLVWLHCCMQMSTLFRSTVGIIHAHPSPSYYYN